MFAAKASVMFQGMNFILNASCSIFKLDDDVDDDKEPFGIILIRG